MKQANLDLNLIVHKARVPEKTPLKQAARQLDSALKAQDCAR